MNKMAYLGWLIGLLLWVINFIIEICKLNQKGQMIQRTIFKIYLIHKILEMIGIVDFIISSNGVDLPKILFDKNLNGEL